MEDSIKSVWKCCKKQPPETGKKVLCFKEGDLYVAFRLGNYYIPMPFADHYFSRDLSFPETWSEIDFPQGITGHTTVAVDQDNYKNLMTLSELEVDYPEDFKIFSEMLIGSLGTLKRNVKTCFKRL